MVSITRNYIAKSNNTEKHPKSINFGSSTLQNTGKKLLPQVYSAAAASLGIAAVALSKINDGKKQSLNNEEIISIINSCKEDEANYNLEKLSQAFNAIAKTNSEDEESKVIISLLRALGNPEDWVKTSPLFAKFLSETIVKDAYKNKEVCDYILEGLAKKQVSSTNIVLYERYLEDGYSLKNANFSELHDKSCYLSRLPYDSENFKSYSFETRDEIIKQVEKLVQNNVSDEDIENFTECTELISEKIIFKAFDNIEKLKNIEKNLKYSIERELRNTFEPILRSNVNEQERKIITNHMLSIAFLAVFDEENYKNIINCPFYSEIIRDKKYVRLFENFDYDKPYNIIDFRKKVSEFETREKEKLQDSCPILGEVKDASYYLKAFSFEESELEQILKYINNSSDENFMKEALSEMYNWLNLSDKDYKTKFIRFIKYLSTQPEVIRPLYEKTSNSPYQINSALEQAERFGNTDFIDTVVNSSAPVEYWGVIFDNCTENNIKYLVSYLKNIKEVKVDDINILLALKNFENPKNLDFDSILQEVYTVQEDTGLEINARYPDGFSSLLNLKAHYPNIYQRILESGFFKKSSNEYTDVFLDKNSDLNKNVYEDLEKIKKNQSIVRKFDKSISKQKAFAQSKCGDVIEINNKLYINDGKRLVRWQMTKEKFLELFPPLVRFITKQGNLGDCYLVSSFSSIMQNPKARAQMYQLFRQEGKDLYVTIKGYEDYKGTVKFKDGKNPWDNRTVTEHLSGSKGLQLLEYAYAKVALRENCTAENVSVTDDIDDTVLMKRITAGHNNIAIAEILGLKFDSVKKVPDKFNKMSIEIDKEKILNEKEFENILEKYTNNENYILNFGTDINFSDKNYNITERHAHSIIGYDKSKKLVYIENPHDCAIVIKIPLNKLYEIFDQLYITSLE